MFMGRAEIRAAQAKVPQHGGVKMNIGQMADRR
jgi:hypothetical protein